MSREESKAQTRERLLDSARKVFAERGYHAASVDEVAERAGFSTGALYSNFEGKEDLFLALLERQIEQQVAEVKASVSDRPTVDERARGGAEHWMAYLEREPELVMLFMEFWAYAVRNSDARHRFAQRYARVREALGELITESAQELDVELALAPEQLAAIVDALADGFALQKLTDPDSISDDLFANALMLLFDGARRTAPVGL